MGLLSRFKQKQESSDTQDSGEFRSRTEEESIQTRARGKKADSARKNKSDDPILPEKKRARRRLIGAVALALAAIIGLPMVLDSEPKPLQDDVNIRIPSKDQPLDESATTPPPAHQNKHASPVEPLEEIIDPVSEVNPTPPSGKSQASTVQAKLPQADAKANAKAAPKSESPATAKTEPKSENKPAASVFKPTEKSVASTKQEKMEGKAELKTEAKAVKSDTIKPVVAKPGTDADETARALAILEGKTPVKVVSKPESNDKSTFSVQVAALASQEKVDELQTKLKSANIKSYTQKVATTSGEKIRVRIGPFQSKDETDKMRAKLSKLGLNGTLIPN